MFTEPLMILNSFDLRIFDLAGIAKIFAEHTKNSDLLLLSGKVGVGKTEFARLLIEAKAIKANLNIEEVSSPTFSMVQSYEFPSCNISHIDLYRVKSELELFELGIPDVFDGQITILEWPEILETINLSRYINIKIKETNQTNDCRDIKIEFFGHSWDHLNQALLQSRQFNVEKI